MPEPTPSPRPAPVPTPEPALPPLEPGLPTPAEPVGVAYTGFRHGYVWKYTLKLLRTPTKKDKIYFKVTISSKADEEKDPVEFVLLRNIRSEAVDRDGNGKFWSVSFSSISMAIIATLKDALISGKKVTVYGTRSRPYVIQSVEITKGK